MKKMVSVLIVLVLAALVASTPAMSAIEVEGDVYAGVYDKYLWRGFDLSGSKSVAQGGVDLTSGNFTLSYWTNIQLSSDSGEGYKSGEATENDLVIDYSHEITELVSVSVGNIYYMLDGIDDTNELYLSASLSTILEPSVTIYYDWDEADENGLYYTAAVGHSFDVMEDLSVSLGGLVAYNEESDYAVGNYSDWHNYELSVGADYALTDQLSISPSFVFSEGISDEAKDTIESETLGGVSVTLTF